MKKVTVLIVNWNGVELLKDCLPTLKNQTYQNFEVIVVDNGSDDGSQAYVRKAFPEALIIQLDKNYGFAKPNNIGLSKASGEYIFTLNNDVFLENDFLEKIVKFFDSQPEDVFSVNPKILYYYRPNTINTVGIKLLQNGGGVHLGKNGILNSYNQELDIFGVCAGCAIYRKKIIDKLGMFFDESYFAYLEDVELSIRARLNGYKSKYYPKSVCYHKHSQTSKKFPYFKAFLIERNRLRNLLKYYQIENIIFEPFITIFILLKTLKNGHGEEGVSLDQAKILKNIPILVKVLISARMEILTESFMLLRERKRYGKSLKI